MNTPALTDDQQRALDEQGGIVEGESFVILRTDVFRELLGLDTDDELRRQLQIGFDQADRGQLVDWDPQRIKAEGRRRLRQRSDA